MNAVVRRVLLAVPGFDLPYKKARKLYHNFRMAHKAGRYFSNLSDYKKALLEPEQGKTVTIHTKDGLQFTLRRNCMDASILAEVFIDQDYLRGFNLSPHPVVMDIGGYIGDFAIYAAKRAGAARVVVVEPSPQNWKLLTRNIADNRCADTITAFQMAVTDGDSLMMDVDAPEGAQARVQADYCGKPKSRLREIPGISLARLVEDCHLDAVDVLKIDCEGGEYKILLTAPTEVLGRVRNIVFEFHEIPGYLAQLNAVKERLKREGFNVRTHGHLVYASRS